MNPLGLAAPNRIRCQRAAVARPDGGSLRPRGLVVESKRCEHCDVLFYRTDTRTRWGQSRFCSRRCAVRFRRSRAPLVCHRCGGPIPISGGLTRRYCSTTCYHEGKRDRPFIAQKRGRAIAERLYPVSPCEVCGAIERPELRGPARVIQRHHRDGDQMNNAPSNIAFLCKPCHDETHRVMRANGIGRPVGGPRPRIAALLHDRAVALAGQARTMHRAGATYADIGAVLGVHPSSVDRWFRKYPEEGGE